MTAIPIPLWDSLPLLNERWTQVNKLPELSADQDEWEEDEVTILTLDFGRVSRPEMFAHNNQFQLLAPNSDVPYANVGNQVFRGLHERLIGSEILFKHDPDKKPAYTPLTTTAGYRIVFHPIKLTPRAPASQELATESTPQPTAGDSAPVKIGRRDVTLHEIIQGGTDPRRKRVWGPGSRGGKGSRGGRGRGRGRGKTRSTAKTDTSDEDLPPLPELPNLDSAENETEMIVDEIEPGPATETIEPTPFSPSF